MSRARQAFESFIDAALHIRPGEGRRTALLFTHLLLASAVFILGRTVRDTLFLSRLANPLRVLPWMFVLYGVVSAIVVVLYSQVADRVARPRLILASLGVGVATYLVAWVFVRAGVPWIYPAFYVWTEVVANLFIVQFWTLANDLHDARAAKRLFGTIGAARVLGVVLVGLSAGAVVRAIGTPQLIFVLVVLMGGIAVVTLALAPELRTERAHRPGTQPRRHGAPPRISADPYVRALAVMILLIFISLTVGDFQFKAIARGTYRGDDLARFFALFYAGTGTASFLFQVFLTPRILARLGVGAGMSAMPAVFGAASATLLLFPRLAVATVMKFADNGFQYTIHETTLQALYVPFAPEVKARTRAFLDAVVKPLSYGAGGLALVLLAGRMSVPHLSWLTVPMVVLWFAMIPVVRRRYLRTLEATLSARGAFAFDEGFVLDSAGRQALVAALDQGEPRRVLVALEQLASERSDEVTEAVQRLVGHADPLVREYALKHLTVAEAGDPLVPRAALADPVADVRAAAASACAALARDDAVESLAPLLSDPSPKVCANALGGLLKFGGVEGGIVGGSELGRLLGSTDREDLVSAARALRHLGTGAYRPLRRLLAVNDPVVRRAALKAAVGDPDPRLVPALVALLSDPACRHRAGQALVAIGAPAAAPLGTLLGDLAVLRAVKLEVPRLLRRIPAPGTYQVVREHLHAGDSRLRLRLYAALSHLRQELHSPPEPLTAILALVQEEIADAERVRAGWHAARERFGTPLLEEMFTLRSGRVMIRILRILELRYDAEALILVREHLNDPARRANALETLDAVLDAQLRALVMPLADAGAAPPPRAGPAIDPVAFMAANTTHPYPYVALLALEALARRRENAGALAGAKLLAHPDPLVREGAILAVTACGDVAMAARIAPLVADPDPTVARIAARALAHLAGPTAPEDLMYSTVEKILYLKSAPVFEHVAGEDLAPLARIAEVEVHAAGEPIVLEGEIGDALYIIVSGRVRVEHSGRVIAELGPGDTVGEMSVLDSEPRSANVTAAEETEVLRIGSDAFYETLHEQAEIAEGVIRMLCRRVRRLDAEIAGEVAT